MEKIHEEVFNHLRTNYPDLCFTLRKIDKGGRLRKGYWFTGNDNYLAISFWKGHDWRNKTSNIIFVIRSNHSTLFEFIDREDTKKRDLFAKIEKPLKMKPLKNKNGEINKWERGYSSIDSDYIMALDDFLNKEKIRIDDFIFTSDCAEMLGPIDPIEFKRDLDRIEAYRELKGQQIIHVKKEKELPLSIQYLRLKNISRFSEIELDLSEKVICLVGENGSGKTTILRAIVLALVGFSNPNFVKEDVSKLEYELKNFLKIRKAKGTKIEYEDYGRIELGYNKDQKNIIEFRPLPIGLNDEGKLLINEVDIDDSQSDFEVLDENGNFKNLVISFAQTKGVEMPSTIEENPTGTLLDVYSLLYNFADTSFTSVKDWIMQAYHPSADFAQSQKMINIIRKAFEVMSKITDNEISLGEIDVNQNAIPLVKTPDSPEGIPMDLVSQGYENLIGWVGYFIKRLAEVTPEGQSIEETPAICFIDEIDTYLHPKWQRNILKTLVESFKNVQFIVTTHSPHVVANLNKKSVIRIEKGKSSNGFYVEGRDSNSVLADVFGIHERPNEYAQQLNEFYAFLEAENLVKAQELFNQLREKWGNMDTEIVRANIFLEDLKSEMAV
jgi:predicted ATP-binding protein involved in virulence